MDLLADMEAPPAKASAVMISEAPLLELDGIGVSVRERAVLRDVDLAIGAGECHALFDPNGSGKSALVMSIMGLPGYTIAAGRIRFRGEEITSLPPHERARRGIGLFYQRPPWCTAYRFASSPRCANKPKRPPDQWIAWPSGCA